MTSSVLRCVFVAFVALSAGALVYSAVRRPSRVASRLGLRGLKRQRAIHESALWALVEPLVRWLGLRMSRLVPDRVGEMMDEHLMRAGDMAGLTSDEYAALGGLAALVAAALCSALQLRYADHFTVGKVIACGCAGAAIPWLVVNSVKKTRFTAVRRGLPYAIDLLALSMGAGLDFPGAVLQVVERSKSNEWVREELAFILQQLQVGHTRNQALKELERRVPIDAVREFVAAVVMAEERGNPVAAILEVQAVGARVRRTLEAEKAAEGMKSALIIPTLCFSALLMGYIGMAAGKTVMGNISGLSGAAK